ncbi:MAG: beta-phosphoglucomutase family hydrolase [Candidatus Omnitrophica bacterium]|nr:beta-phosphoglucomutase family hydrolase [Candidatus Omnitrophota bacterium]
MSFKGAIFDLDGVIVNTVPLHFKAWKRMFGEYGKEFTMKDYEEKVDGIPRMDGARAILTELSQEELENAALKKQRYFLEFLIEEGVNVYDSTVNLMKELKSSSVSVAVISSSKNCPDILSKAGVYPYIDVEINGKQIVRGKPDPWIFEEAAKRLRLEPSECVVFEDAVLGVEAGKRANMFTVGIDRRNAPERLKKADMVVKDLSEVNFEKLNNILSGKVNRSV